MRVNPMNDSTDFVAYLSLVIAVIGGVPGIVECFRFVRERNKLLFLCQCFTNSEMQSEDGAIRRQCLILSGLLTNKGAIPVYPMHFDLYWPSDRSWARLEPRLIPRGAHYSADRQEIVMDDPAEKDLQKCSQALVHGVPRYGHLMFLFPEELRWDYKAIPMPPKLKLVCTDSVERKHTMHVRIQPTSRPAVEYPQLGMKVINR